MTTAYFKHGMLYAIKPTPEGSLYDNRDLAYKMDFLVSDGIKYDLSKKEDVAKIRIPAFSATWDILELSYIMKIRCGCVNDPFLLPSFISVTLKLMQHSKFMWRRRDYLQVIRNYYRLGLFDKGDSFERRYRLLHHRLFSKQEDEKHEAEHESTKQYFRRKWEKQHHQ